MTSRTLLFPLIGWLAFVLALIAFLMLISGCAAVTLPSCEKFGYTPITFNGDPAALLDEEGMAKLRALILGLAQGTCRLPPAGPET